MKAQDLKNSILQLAIQGKLVEQREEEGTAKELIEQIQTEKEKLIKEKKIKKEKPLPEITEDEKPFDIPKSWEWVRLGDSLDIARGGSPRPIKAFITDSEDGVNWIKIGDTDKGGKYINSTNEKIIKEGMKKSRFVKKGDFLLSNSMSFGRPYILNIDGCIHDGWLVLSQITEVFNKDFLYYLLSSRMVFNQFQSIVSGAVVNNLNSDKVRLTIVPIPPLEEQKRIVAKIEELMPYVDQYDKAYTEVEELNKKFPEDMQKSILQYAIQGKLVEQREEEGTAEELYQKIQAEKEKLIKEGKIKKSKPLPEITEDEIPFDIPESWKWVRFGEMVNFNMGKTPPRSEPKYWKDDYNWVSIADMIANGYIHETKEKISEIALNEKFKKSLVSKGTLLMSFKLTVGRVSILDIDAVHNEAIISIYPYADLEESIRNYLFTMLPLLSTYGETKGAIKGKTLNSTSLNNLLIPLPPLEEQKRIVEKIEELLPHTKQLVKKLD